MRTREHKQHIASRCAHNNCPECRADNSRRFAMSTPFRYEYVHEYLRHVRPLLEAIQTGKNGGDSIEAKQWLRYQFRAALHKRISSHIPDRNGRKHAPDYAKCHLSTYGNDWNYLNT